jgi:hypothetical protein
MHVTFGILVPNQLEGRVIFLVIWLHAIRNVQNHPEEAELLNTEINDFGWKRCVMGDFSLHCDAQQKRAVSLKSTKSLHNASSLKGGI